MNKNTYVTQPFLPPLSEYIPYLEKIWNSHILTNNGPFHQQLENNLCEYLGCKYISLFSNGTLALITALQALDIKGEVITTPFSFVASTHCLLWNGIKPVFCDIENEYFNLDPAKIEYHITKDTTAILPVHVYGNPCQYDEIKLIADKYNLKLIFDAAHAFGVRKNNYSICNWGDLSILSFHATKVYNTFEGGAIVCHDENMKRQIDDLKNFGFRDEITVVAPGINAKMNEIQSAMGLLQLQYIDDLIEKRKIIAYLYRDLLSNTSGIHFLNDIEHVHHNYSYFPILIENDKYGKSRDEIYELLKRNNIFSRKYFFPLISHFHPYNNLESAKSSNLQNAEKVSEQILCLPMYDTLEFKTVEYICKYLTH